MSYIEREAVNALIKAECSPKVAAYLIDAVATIPAADVWPVVRGKWVNDHNGKYSASGDNFYCSICKDPSLRAFGKPAKTNYCPNCGADMRIFSTNCKNTVTTGEDREISNLRAMSKKESKVMGVYIPNLDEKKFYEICKEHNLDFIAIPADDVRPVVLCRDCEYYQDCGWCGLFDIGMNVNDFCSRGEKREEN